MQRIAEPILQPLGDLGWHIVIGFDDDMKAHTLADTTAQWEYMQAFIRFNTRLSPERTDEEITHVILHEAGHVLLSELETEKKKRQYKAEERVCTMLAIWVMALLELDFGEATDADERTQSVQGPQ